MDKNNEGKLADGALQDSEEELKAVFEQVRVGIALLDAAGRVVRINRRLEELTGYSEEELKGKRFNFLKMFPPKSIVKIHPVFAEMLSGEQVTPVNVEIHDRRGLSKQVELHGFALKKGEEVARLVTTMQEIPDIRGETSEINGYRALFEHARDAILLMEAEGLKSGQIVEANPAAAEMHGYTMEELLTMNIRQLFAPETVKRFPQMLQRMLEGEWVKEEVTLRKKDGAVFPVEISAGLLEFRSRRYIFAMGRDITERKRVEREICDIKNYLETIIRMSYDGIFVVDDEGGFEFCNDAFFEILGYADEEIIGQSFMMAIPTDHHDFMLERWEEIQKGEGKPFEVDVVRKDGSRRSLLVSHKEMDIRGERKYCVVVKDITERKKAEEEIKRYTAQLEETNRMKELFADILHHDLLNPLTVINGYVELLLSEENAPEKLEKLKIIEKNISRALEMIENASVFSKLESAEDIEFEEMDLREVIEKAVLKLNQLIATSGMEIENRVTSQILIKANKILEHVFVNLINNAVKYASEGKRIIIEGEDRGDCLQIKVVDFGEGIKNSDKKLIFERFAQTKQSAGAGSGLGLAIVKKIVELHNGRIWVEDNPEGGAVFVVELCRKV
jgi:PAS domain S-box-containing protein